MSPEALLAFESRWPRHSGHKESAIRGELGVTPARFYQLLRRAARSGEGIAADPITARRVRDRSNGDAFTPRFGPGSGRAGQGVAGSRMAGNA